MFSNVLHGLTEHLVVHELEEVLLEIVFSPGSKLGAEIYVCVNHEF